MDRFEVRAKSTRLGRLKAFGGNLLNSLKERAGIIECDHEWEYEDYILTSYPPQHPKKCVKCGKEDVDRGFVD